MHFISRELVPWFLLELRYGRPAKLMFVMRVSLFYMVLLLGSTQLLFAYSSFGQLPAQRKTKIEMDDESLKVLFAKLKEQTGLSFVFPGKLEEYKNITFPMGDRTVREVLDIVLNTTDLAYRFENNTVFIYERKKEGTVIEEIEAPVIFPDRHTISGKVMEAATKLPLAGVNIVVKGTTRGTTTDTDGNFSIDVEGYEVLVFTFIGLKTVEEQINDRTVINVIMENDITSLIAVEVVGTSYFSTTKEKSVMNIAKVEGKDIGKQPVTSLMMSLQGRLAGVDITPYSGTPGSAINIMIRGQNSLRWDGGYPLYVIDGVPIDSRPIQTPARDAFKMGIDPLSTLSPANIESIEVLKDGAATSIYGSRGANGVVRITTKKGNATDRTHFDLGVYYGVGQMAQRIKLLSTEQYLEMRNEALFNDGIAPSPYDYDINGTWDNSRYTDWQEVLLGGNAHITDIQTGISGGNKNTSFRLSGGLHKEKTIYPGDFGHNVMTGNFSFNHTSANGKFNSTLSMNYGLTKTKHFDNNNYTSFALTLPPNAPPLYDENGELNWQIAHPLGQESPTISWINPLSYLKDTHEATNGAWVINSTVVYEVGAGLSLKTNMGFTDGNGDEILKRPIAGRPPMDIGPNSSGTSTFAFNKRKSWIIEPQITYIKNFADHALNIVFGTSWQESRSQHQTVFGDGYTSDVLLNSIQGANTRTFIADESVHYRYNALFGRIGYDYNSRYLIDLTGRRDGSSRFGPGNRYGNFVGAGVGWIFSKEKFFSKCLSFISFGKIRASYATTGNDQIPDYGFYNTYSITPNKYQGVVSLTPTALYNPDYGWEVTRKTEIAMELAFFDDRISVETSAYRNRSSNQLVNYPLPAVTGFELILSNFDATVENRGFEFVISSKNLERSGFKWTTSFNLTIPENRLLEFDNIESSPYATQYKVGEPLTITRKHTWLGINPQTGIHEILDANKDGIINDDDKTFSTPLVKRYYGGLINTINYRAFELSFLLQFVNQTQFHPRFSAPGSNGNQPVAVLDRWRRKGDISSIQKFSADPVNVNMYEFAVDSNHGMIDASFIRLKTISLSYAVPGKILNVLRLQSTNLFVQMQNVFTITDFPALDPDTGFALPPLRTITAGIQLKL